MKRKKFYKVESRNPQNEKWFHGHEWKVIKTTAPTNVVRMQCAFCNSEILCLGFICEKESDEKTYIFDIEQEDLTCDELCIRDLIE